MARRAFVDWILPDEVTWQNAELAVAMDIRDRLTSILAALSPLHVLTCRNFQQIPMTLKRIEKNTTKPGREMFHRAAIRMVRQRRRRR